jgi:hypothetical protein
MRQNIGKKFPGLDPYQEEMKKIVIQREQELYEAMAQYQATQSSALSGGGSNAINCDPESGLSLYALSEDGDFTLLLRFEYSGLDENNKPNYGISLIPDVFEGSISYDGDNSMWKLNILSGEESYNFYSNSLPPISSIWTLSTGAPFIPQYTDCGIPSEIGNWCINVPDFGFGEFNIQAFPGWVGNPPVSGLPELWGFTFGLYLWTGEGWYIAIDGVGETFIEGGSQDTLPEEAEIEGITLTATSGMC